MSWFLLFIAVIVIIVLVSKNSKKPSEGERLEKQEHLGMRKTAYDAARAESNLRLKAGDIKIGDNIWIALSDDKDLIGKVEAAAIYEEVEEDKEDQADADEWFEFELRTTDSTLVYLSSEFDDEDREEWYLHERIDNDTVRQIPGFEQVAYDSKNQPPKKFEYAGATWKAATWQDEGEEWVYDAECVDRRIDRTEKSQYECELVDYSEVGGKRVFGLELWEGGLCATVGHKINVEKVTLALRAETAQA